MAPAPPLPVTEDTPPDMLAGSMDLQVVLPDGHTVKMSVERSTPMMDLLVQVTTLNKISTGGHVLQAVGEKGLLPYKPSTPIGALDAWTIQVVPKLKAQMSTGQKKAPLKPLNQQQPFEQTFRLQVHLPRNQLFVMRVSQRTLLSDILHLTCAEKNLDPNKFELRHPANLSQLLSPSCTLADYGLQEVTVVGRSHAPGMGSALSSSDIMALQREEDKRRQQARQQRGAGTGLGLVCNKRNRSSYCDGSISSDSLGGRSISPARSDESASRSASPQAPNLPPMMAPVPPARPARKRRPAPKPPCSNNGPISSEQQMESNVQAESSSGTDVNGHSGGNNSKATHVPVSHSRNSSDSSGYHEASVLSESPAEGNQMSENCTVDTLPRQGKLTSGHQTQMKACGSSHGLSRSMSSLSGVGNMARYQHSTSNSSLASSTGQGQKKKRAPPPPPGVGVTKDDQQQRHLSSLSLSSTDQDTTESFNKTTSLERHMSGKIPAVASGQSPDKSSTLPGKMKMSHRPVETTVQTSADTLDTDTQSPEEMCLDGDEKISEVERASVPHVPEETSPIHSETHEDELINATKNQSSDRNISKTQDECFQHSPVPPVETAPESPVELASRSKCPQTVDTSTPQARAALEQEPTLHIPVPKPRIRSKPSALDATVPLARRTPVPPQRLMSNSSSSSVLQSTNMDSSNVQEERCIQSVNAEGRSDGRSTEKKQGKNGSAGQTFGVGTTMLMLFKSGTDSISSDSCEYHSIRSQSSADVDQDSDDDLNFTDKEMDMFDVMMQTSEVSGTIRGGNVNQNNTVAVNRVVDSFDDYESVSPVSSVFDYDSEHESSETSSAFRYPPLHTQMRTKGENVFGASNVGSPHVTGRKGLQKKVVPGVDEGSSTSLQSTDRVTAFMKNGNNSMEASASKQSWLLGYESEANTSVNFDVDAVDQVDEAFKSVIVELEDTIRRDEEMHTLPPPPTSASSVDDLAEDWQYQLPAPPSAFRDSDSPTLTEGGTIMLADSQVLRSILPQLNQSNVLRDNQAVIQQQKSDSVAFLRSKTSPTKLTSKNAEELSNHNSVKDATSATSEKHNANEKTPNDKNTNEGRRYSYQGPPAVNFATWNERPKSQVTIKMDRDYRRSIGQAGPVDDRNETLAQTGNSKSKGKTLVVERNGDIETLQQSRNDEVNAQNKVNNKMNSSQQVTKTEPASLTMRLISHTTATGFRKTVAAASRKVGTSSYIAEEAQKVSTSEAKETTGSSTAGLRVGSTFQQSDPSRVPIVRAVELKKSFIQQQNMHSNSHALHRSSTKLNGEEDGGHRGANMVDQRKSTSHHNEGSDEDLAQQTFAGVNILAKRFSSVVPSSNVSPGFSTSQPLSFYGEVDPVNTKGNDSTTSLPYNSTLSYKSVSSTNLNASNVNKYQDTQLKNGDGRGPRRYTSVVGINSDSDHSLSSSFHEPASESNRVLSRVPGSSVVRVNGFTAPKQLMPVVKGFQFASPPSPTKISNTSAHHPRVQRSESTSAIRSWRTVDATDHPSSTGFGNINTYVQKNTNESRPETVIMNVTTNVESKPPPPPPQAAFLRKSTTQPRPKSLPAPQLNPRDQLMDAIRNFGGRESLKHVHDNRDSSLNTMLIQ